MEKSTFNILKMDCPSEEQIIKMKLQDLDFIKKMEFDIPNRRLIVFHNGNLNELNTKLESLNFDSKLESSKKSDEIIEISNSENEKKLLWAVLLINGAFFLIEFITGLTSKSMGLISDSLDMLADALVYSLSLFAINKALKTKKHVATISGYLQLILAFIGLFETVRRFLGSDNPPNFATMIFVSCFALIGNSICLFLLQKSKSEEAHIKASLIFTSNDVVINLGVIAAGFLVYLLSSNKPDLIIGVIVFLIVMRGAIRIIKLGL